MLLGTREIFLHAAVGAEVAWIPRVGVNANNITTLVEDKKTIGSQD